MNIFLQLVYKCSACGAVKQDLVDVESIRIELDYDWQPDDLETHQLSGASVVWPVPDGWSLDDQRNLICGHRACRRAAEEEL